MRNTIGAIMIIKNETSITIYNGIETLRIEAWGKGIRVRCVPVGEIPEHTWALDRNVPCEGVNISDDALECAGLRCEIHDGRLSFIRKKDNFCLLEEPVYPWALHRRARELHPLSGNSFSADIYFKAYNDEKLYGMGQYRDASLDQKGRVLELAPRNSQISVPFLLSSRGYGFLWNDPSVGMASFAENMTKWHTESTQCIDYWVTCGDTPKDIIRNFSDVTGKPSELPSDLLGLWQCKLRYRTQDEVLSVAREYKKRGIAPDVIVIDFFHWNYQGDWSFDSDYWPDPKAMADELREMGIHLMVSVWPTVDSRSKNFKEFSDNGFLIRTNKGMNTTMDFYGKMYFFDSTNPYARKRGYQILKENYGSCGIKLYWLDEAEPEYSVYDYDHYRQFIGSTLETGNFYSRCHAQMLYDGQKADGQKDILNLIRCAWIGSAKYGTLVWSGDIESTFEQMKIQLRNAINMGIAGIPWWISDTGGFYNGNIEDPMFKELLIRWFEWAVYMPILRMHGDRQPNLGSLVKDTDHGGGFCPSGSGNEIWSYGEDVYEILKKHIGIREELKEYIRISAEETVQTGIPLIRAMFLEFPDDLNCYDIDDQYMFGEKYLVAPVTEYMARQRRVYLPKGKWKDRNGIITESGGEYVTAHAKLDEMPVFERIQLQ